MYYFKSNPFRLFWPLISHRSYHGVKTDCISTEKKKTATILDITTCYFVIHPFYSHKNAAMCL